MRFVIRVEGTMFERKCVSKFLVVHGSSKGNRGHKQNCNI